MTEFGKMPEMTGGADEGSGQSTPRGVGRSRRLPGGRAVVGAFLVTAAAVVTFSAYLSASAGPTTAYLVATRTIEPGTRLADIGEIHRLFGTVHVELVPPLDERAVPASDLDDLVGRVLVAPLGRGDLVTRTTLVEGDGQGSHAMSIAVAPDDAVAGALRPGEYLDVLATFGSGDGATTIYVVRGVPLLRTSRAEEELLGTSGELVLTVALDELRDVQAVGHARNTGQLFVTRSTARAGEDAALPPPFRPSHDDGAVEPDRVDVSLVGGA